MGAPTCIVFNSTYLGFFFVSLPTYFLPIVVNSEIFGVHFTFILGSPPSLPFISKSLHNRPFPIQKYDVVQVCTPQMTATYLFNENSRQYVASLQILQSSKYSKTVSSSLGPCQRQSTCGPALPVIHIVLVFHRQTNKTKNSYKYLFHSSSLGEIFWLLENHNQCLRHPRMDSITYVILKSRSYL